MKEIAQQITSWHQAGERAAVATVIRVAGSAPRPVGARLALSSSGEFAGSVSGGCVENTVIQEAEQVLQDEQPRRLHFGITQEMSWEVGLACGGTIDVLVQLADPPIWAAAVRALEQEQPRCLLTVVGGDRQLGEQAVVEPGRIPADFPFPEAIPAAQDSASRAELVCMASGVEVLVEPLLPPPHLIVFGAVHAAIPLSRMAKTVGFRVTIADPRSRLANRDRFPDADQILVKWPQKALAGLRVDGRTAIAILTHDPKIDEPALTGALETEAFYIGAIGSRGTHAERHERLARLGLAAGQLQRVHGPIGLDLGGRSAEELALSILAEIVAVRNGRGAGSLQAEGGG